MRATQTKGNQFPVRFFAVTAMLFCCALVARAEFSIPGIEKTLHVFPSTIDSRDWENVNSLYFQDLDEYALYQDFNRSNSAHLKDPNVEVVPPSGEASTESETQPEEAAEVISEEAADDGTLPPQDISPEVLPDEEPPAGADEEPPADSAEVSSGPFRVATTRLALLFETLVERTRFVIEGTSTVSSEEALIEPVDSPAEPENISADEVPSMTPETESDQEPVEETVIDVVSPESAPEAPEEPSVSNVGTSTEELSIDAGIFCEGMAGCEEFEIVFEGFSIPTLEASESIEGAQIRFSFASRETGALDDSLRNNHGLFIEYDLGSGWEGAGAIPFNEEVSNALNGGYFLFALPAIEQASMLEDLRIRVRYFGEREAIEGLFLDSLWLETRVLALDEELLRARALPEALKGLKQPGVHELLSRKLDFTQKEMPSFALRYHEQRNFFVKLFRKLFANNVGLVDSVSFVHKDVGPVGVVPEVTVTPEGLWTIRIPESERDKMRPGLYTLSITVDEGGRLYEDSFEFQWGLLALNTDRSEYEAGETAAISLASLSPNGNTVCDARLLLYVIQPEGFIRRLPVAESGFCNGNNVTDVPDYAASYVTGVPGTHTLYLERVDETGSVIAHSEDTFEVVVNHDLSITRTGPTRIYPVEPYRMDIEVAAHASLDGVFTETVPQDFEVFDTDARVYISNDRKVLEWDLSILQGQSKTLSYSFDAPDLSPFLYTLGPASFVAAEGGISEAPVPAEESSVSATEGGAAPEGGVADTADGGEPFSFTEHRSWQIASDATGNMIIFYNATGAIPAGWTCLSCGSGTFYQRFVRGDATYNSTGGATTHTPTASTSLFTSSAATIENFGSGSISVTAHNHALVTPTIGSANNLPSYGQLRVLQYTNAAGEPPSLPAGAVVLFNATPPAGWTSSTTLQGRYPYGENIPGVTGGSNTHSHTIATTTGPATGSTVGARGGGTQVAGANAGHTHSISTSTVSTSSEPAYIETMFGEIGSATTTMPSGMIAMWTDTPPAGWLNISANSGDPFYQRIVKFSSAYGTTGGSDTHTHANETSIVTGAPSGTTLAREDLTTPAGSAGAHTHLVDVTNFSSTSKLPPYVTAIFALRQGTDPVYEQLSYRLFTNTNAQTPTDPWPSGAENLVENEPLTSTSTPIKNGEEIRIRMNVAVSNATTTAGSQNFRLQYGEGSVCSSISTWTDVGASTSTSLWRGYDNASPSDGSTLSSTTLSSTDRVATYEENNPSALTPNDIYVGEAGEWDWVLEHNSATSGVQYCFRMVEEDGTAFYTYTRYPTVYTDASPVSPDLSAPFDNEKVASTSPWFEFTGTDPEGQDLHYQIQIDDDVTFASTFIDNNTESNGSRFENLVNTSQKEPYTSGDLIRFTPGSALTDGTTYWWRVRAKDPDGSNEYGEWSTAYSVTIDTLLNASAWFQTTNDQFDTNALVGVESGSGSASLITGSTTGTMTTGEIDFDWGLLGTAWDSLSWSDTETSGDLKYQIEYYTSGGSWAAIPDSDLPGNSAGFDTSPVDLLSLDTDTYNQLRLIATFTNSGGSPSLQHWTLSWGYRVETPTITKLFPNEKVGTTTPVFEFSASDPQDDALTYQIQWSTDYTFTSSTTRTSDTDTGFENVTTPIEPDPFTSGDTIRFTIQPGDALTDGMTYWWRVRAKDPPPGADNYSLWSNPRSFTVASTVVASTWFQTTDEQFDTNILSGTETYGVDRLRVATSADEALAVYAEGLEYTPRYREWNGTSWGTEGSALSVGAPVNWVALKAGTTREEYIAGTLGTDSDVNFQVYSEGSWGDLYELATEIDDIKARGFDIAYETTSGDAIAVACDGDADPSYIVWNGSSWGSGGTINFARTDDCSWISLAADPVSDEIIVLSRGTAGTTYSAQVWDGSSWGNETTLGSINSVANEGMAVEYEESGGQALVAVSDGSPPRFAWNSWNGSVWGTAATQAIGNDLEWGYLARDSGSDNMVLCYVDDDADAGYVRWTGSAWAGQGEFDTLANSNTDRPTSCVFETTSGRDGYIMGGYSDDTNARYSFYNNTTWSTEASVDTIGDSATVQLRRTGDGTILGFFFDDANDRYDFSSWDGSSWLTLETLETNASVSTAPYGEPFMIAPREPGNTGTVIVAPGIDFTEGSGPYWQEMSWVDTTPGTSNILYQVQYQTATGTWLAVPDSVIPGNSTGTTTSPINLTGLSVSTYGILRPRAELTCDGSNNCPELYDWTIEWAEGITVSGTLLQYDQTSSTTSGTVEVAVNGVLQTGKTGSVSNGSWSIANVNAAAGDVVTVFVGGAVDSAEAVGVTVYDGSGNITGFNLYERHLAIGSDDYITVHNADIELYDSTDDEDVFVDVNGTNDLTVCGSGACHDAELIIKSGNTYQPGSGGDVTTHDIEINGTFLPNGNTIRIGGSWDNNATATAATSTIMFTATSTSETIDNTGAVSGSFYNLTFGEGSGNAVWSPVTTLDINGALQVAYGTLARSTLPITLAGNLTTGASGLWSGIGTTTFDGTGSSVWTDNAATKQNIGHAVIDGTSKTVTFGSNVKAESVTIGSDDVLDASTSHYDIDVFGNWRNNNTFAARNGTVAFMATSTGFTITHGASNFYDLTFGGVNGGWSFTQTTVTATNDVTVSAGTVTLPNATTTVGGSWNSTGGLFAHSNGTLYFTSSGAESVTFAGSGFDNTTHNLTFGGAGSFTMSDAYATTSNDVRISAGAVTLPSSSYSIGGSFINTGGTFAHNSGILRMTSSGSETLDTNGSAYGSLTFAGSGSWSFADSSLTAENDFTVLSGTVTLPSGTLTIGGSYDNNAAINTSSGTVLFNSADTGETIDFGGVDLYNVTVQSATGGWTILENATTTNNFTLASSSDFTLTSGKVLSVGSVFTNSVGGASTTWAGTTLHLWSGTSYALNTKSTSGDVYGTLSVAGNTDISVWNSSAASYAINASGSLYSQDHAAVDGDLYIFGAYERTSGTEHWSYATDFDGTSLSGSERQVDVRLSSGSSAAFTGSALSIVGNSVASTTVAAQSGTYTVSVTNGSTTASHYRFSDLGTSGFSLLGTTTVHGLSDGSFTPATNAGTGITVSSSTIDTNPGKQIFRVEFATTTAITASNVTQTGTAPSSYWWFRNSYGNLDGEFYDSDTGDPGSVRWDDSSLTITISGTVYSDIGVTPISAPTCDGVTSNVRVVVGGTTYDGTCSVASSTYAIPGVVVLGDPTVTVFLNTNGGSRAVAVTKTPTADITDMDLYANRVIVRHEDTEAMTIEDMAAYDYTDDTDVPFVAATGTPDTLTVRAEHELLVADGMTFEPGGDVTLQSGGSGQTYDGTLHIDNNATLTATGTEAYSVGGRFLLDAGATFTPASSTVTMTATTSGKAIITPPPNSIDFHNLAFTGVGGEWDISGDIAVSGNMNIVAGAVTGDSDITVTDGSLFGSGSLTLSSGTTTIESTNTLGSSTPWTFYNLILGDGSQVGTTTRGDVATTTVLGVLTIDTGHTLDVGSSRWDLRGGGTPLVIQGVFDAGTGMTRYSASTTASVSAATYFDLDLHAYAGTPTYTPTGLGIVVEGDLTVGGDANTTVNFDTNDTALSVDGDVIVRQNGTFIASASGALTFSGSFDNNGTFTGSGGLLTFDGAGTHTIAPGSSSFSNITIDGTGSFTVVEDATSTAAWTLTDAGSFTVSSGESLAVGGTFTNNIGGAETTWSGSTLRLYSGTSYSANASTTADQYDTLSIGADTDVRLWNSSASTTLVNASGSLYSQDHANVTGDLYIFGAYEKTSGTDYWSYATDFDGTTLGSPRKADVYFASGASATYGGGSLEIVGDSTASTTLQNQGSGTYSVTFGGTGTLTANYYEVRDMASAGLVITGAPTVASLSYGDIEVSQNGGTGITLGGTVIDQNPAKTITQNRFATTTAITATNVTATGTSVSSWRFTNHYDNLSGEAFDVDPDGDPGYVVWDNSAAQITISGNVYQDEGSLVSGICDGSTQNIYLRIAGVTSTTTSCDGGTGAYSFPGISYGPTDTLTLYITGESVYAANVAVDPVSSIANMHLYENRVIVRHENTSPISIADMAVWDSSDDADIPFTAVDAGVDTLTLPANRKLIVWGGKTFTPGGNVTLSGGGGGADYDGTLELNTNAAFVAQGTESHSIGGSLISNTNAALTPAQATFTFTTSGAARTVDTNSGSLYNTVFNGSGSWTMSDPTITISNDFTISSGAVTLPSATTTIGGSFQNTGGSFTHSGGTLLFTATGAGEVVRGNGSTFNKLFFSGSGGGWTMSDTNATTTYALTIAAGTVTLPSGTLTVGSAFNTTGGSFTHNSGTLRLTGTSTDTVLRGNGSDFGSTTFSGSGSYLMTDADVTLDGALTITQGSVTFATGTLSIGGSFQNTGGSFAHASGTVLFNSADSGETITTGGSPFNNVSFASAGGGWTVTDNATTTGNFTLSSASSFTLASSTTLGVEGVFTNLVGGSATTWDGSTLFIDSESGYTINTTAAGGDRYNRLIVGEEADLRSWNSSATTTLVAGTGSLYSQDHAASNGSLYIFGDYLRTTGADYWSYATDFDGTDLTGGSERQVTVSIAENATTTVTGATLAIRGGASATTTVTNQGSGTYTLIVDDGTINAQYYAVRNANADGLALTGLNTITSLGNGDFELAVPGGSLITVSSTTVNANASLTIVGMEFSTTTAITGVNVELVGTTPNAWTFSGHYGNLGGESFDLDDGTECGSLRWDDSSCLLIEQTAYRWRNDDGGEGAPSSEWYDVDWTKRTRVKFTNSDATEYTDAVLEVPITYDADMQSDFGDIRFTASDGTTALSYWIETYTASTDAVAWVKVPTLAASDETSVFIYYGNGAASDASSGTSTFTVFDDFEDNDIAEYSGNTTLFTTDGAGAYERTYRLEAADVSGKTTDGIYDTSVSVGQGETVRFFQYIDTGFPQDETCTLFGVETPGSDSDNYGVCLSLFGTDRLSISKDISNTDDDDGAVRLATTPVTFSTGWHEVEVRWGTDDTIEATLYKDDVLVAATSTTDSTYTAAGGIGFSFWINHGGWDAFTTRPLLETEPSVTFGAEQSAGGASWAAALNSPVTAAPSSTQRIRFVVENTGLAVTDQNFRLEYAPKGAAPSCESVSYGDYTPVPASSGCGGEDICMVTSSQFVNQASTTDLIDGAGLFTYGQIIESTSNSTADIDVGSGEFTELEYAVQSSQNASDSNYCLRVTDGGTDLDGYTRVAELQLRFDPVVLSWSLNDENDIVLSPGATTTVSATGTVSDVNGYSDFLYATSTIYRSALGPQCTADNNNCYQIASTSCAFSNCSGDTCDLTCSADIYFFADPTDDGAYVAQDWRADLRIVDQGGGDDTQSTIGSELLTLRALDVESSIDYGSLGVSDDTGSYNPTTTVENIGNDSIDVSLNGVNLTDGGWSSIPVSYQKYATSTFTYATCTYCSTLSTTTTPYEVDLSKPTTTTPVISDDIFWGISIPFGVAANPHEGINTFTATGD